MKTKNLSKYRKNRVEKNEVHIQSVAISRAHKVFIESQNLNLSAIVRDALDFLSGEKITPLENQARKLAQVFTAGKVSPDAEIEKLIKILEGEE